jgi:hypothetical protein
MLFKPVDYSVVFLSYDEPNCDENYQHLLTLYPKALRVHGVKGSDTAHKACADIATTDRFIIVDGDNYVRDNFFSLSIPLEFNDKHVISFSGYNTVNGTQYGNGGIKCWHKDVIRNMRTHENSIGDKFTIDFDYHNYIELNDIGSGLRITSSPLQAWRAGFRETFKLSLDDTIDWRNKDRLYRWMHIGSDVDNGLYCIHGARFAYFLMKHEQWNNHSGIRDFDFLNDMFDKLVKDFDHDKLLSECNRLGDIIGLDNILPEFQSKEYRNRIGSPVRSPVNHNPLYDIVFIHNNEVGAEENFNRVKERYPRTKLLSGQKGIHEAHRIAARMCWTDYFWVVDGDSIISDDFDFTHNDVEFYEEPTVRVYRAINPVNGLVYGHGGVKLLPRLATLNMNTTGVDMTTSISTLYKPVDIVSNIHKFDVDSFSAWRTAFRECVKLSSQVIDRQNSSETLERLYTWCSVAENTEFSNEIIKGALMGKRYGEEHKHDSSRLKLINDYSFLRTIYEEKFLVNAGQ